MYTRTWERSSVAGSVHVQVIESFPLVVLWRSVTLAGGFVSPEDTTQTWHPA
ncbi:MAG: hypothetical protein A4E42_00354 [Methanoregulaceae archaeon PtaU1.Bin222]|nr:MAG: hypothetical protein A4E42_00354 [Methanoregulaceae archaeon PtaU1.Bin222]